MDTFVPIENTEEAIRKFGTCYGRFDYKLSNSDIEELLDGKCLATTVNCEEYSIFIHPYSSEAKNLELNEYGQGYFDTLINERDEICNIIFNGEDTKIGRKITIERIKEKIKYKDWLTKDE